jgi:hypothetical protein
MSHIKQFAAYAAAFERAVESDDWSEVEGFFAADAVYLIGLPILGTERCQGRAAIVAWFKDVLDRFDRRFATRRLDLLEGPTEDGDEVWIKGTATYTADGVPDLVLELAETIRFDDDEIVHLEDHYTPEMVAGIARYALEHGAKLGMELSNPDAGG